MRVVVVVVVLLVLAVVYQTKPGKLIGSVGTLALFVYCQAVISPMSGQALVGFLLLCAVVLFAAKAGLNPGQYAGQTNPDTWASAFMFPILILAGWSLYELSGHDFERAEKQARDAHVAEVTDQATLAEIAINSESVVACRSAVDRVTEQGLLLKIARWGCERSVKEAAIRRVTDESSLIELAKTAPDIKCAIAKRLSNQSALLDLIREDQFVFGHLCREAVERLSDQRPLADIARKGRTMGDLDGWLMVITNQGLLAEIAQADPHPSMRILATNRLAELKKRQASLATPPSASNPRPGPPTK